MTYTFYIAEYYQVKICYSVSKMYLPSHYFQKSHDYVPGIRLEEVARLTPIANSQPINTKL